ncbi:MAG: DUF4386 domain-containing protein [Saprospiraceae bacterium]|nr:DUF4386 domain-containing protein [Saprospiraceae bacterium]
MNHSKTIGSLMILGAVALFAPYTLLTIIFDYPDILRKDTAYVLTQFHDGGSKLIWTWFAFAITGLPLLPAYILLGKSLECKVPMMRVATTIGVIGLVVQMIGLLRWTFVVPVLADAFVNSNDEAIKAAAIINFKLIHQFGGVLLGEHLGQLFTIAWTVMVNMIFAKLKLVPTWINWLGYISSVIYLSAQADLFATVMPGFPVWDMAGFIGSTLWLVWLVAVGMTLMFRRSEAIE